MIAVLSFSSSAQQVPTGKPAAFPDWWFERGVIGLKENANVSDGYDYPTDYLESSDFSSISQGQLLYILDSAIKELDQKLATVGGAGFDLASLLENGTYDSANSDISVTIGQLKQTSSKFFTRFSEVGFVPGSPGWPASLVLDAGAGDNSTTYPWLNDVAPENTSMAIIGQAKHLFSWDLSSWFLDADNDGLADEWEYFYFGSIQPQADGSGDPNGDPDGDGITNLNEFLDGTNPNLLPREGHSIWIKEYAQQMITDPLAVDEVVNFCLENNIQVVYLFVGELIVPANYVQWEFVLEKLHAYGVEVEALLDNTDWLMPTGGWTSANNFPEKQDRSDGLLEVGKVLDYQNAHTSSPKQSFDAIHFSINVDSLDSFNDPADGQQVTSQDLIGWYLDFIADVKSIRAGYGAIASSIPFHWDINTSTEDVVSIDYEYPAGGTLKEAWKHLIDQFDQVTLITSLDGIRDYFSNIQDEMDYIDGLANQPGVRLYNEFRSQGQGNNLIDTGFSNEDYLTVANFRLNIESIYGNKSYFKGWALYTYDDPNNTDGSFPSWLASNTPFTYPESMDFVPDGNRKEIPKSSIAVFDKPVYVRLNIKAHPDLEYVNSPDFRNMISFVPIGSGYASENDLVGLNTIVNASYDGIAPTVWWYYPYINWWGAANTSVMAPQLLSRGVCWANPATQANPDLGVEREIVLNEGDEYRFIVAYNRHPGGISEEYFSINLGVINPPGSTKGDSFDDPVEIDIYLDYDPNYGTANSPKPNHSFVIHDTDMDGTSDGQEAVFGLNPFSEDEGNIENPDAPATF